MDTALELLRLAGSAVLQLVFSPFYYIAVILIMLQYMRQTRLERRLFHVRLRAWPAQLLRAIAAGGAVGLALSCAGLFLGVSLTGEAVLWLWAVAVLLSLIRVRYLCFAYAAGILGLMQWAAGWTPLAERSDWLGELGASLDRIDIPGLLLLVALMHAAEALLVRWQGDRLASPLFLEGKRGKLVGGYMLQGCWPVPLLLLVPAASGGTGVSLPWSPLLDGSLSLHGGWTMIGFPMMIGFSEMTRTLLPGDKAKRTSNKLLLYSLIVAAAAVAAVYWTPLTAAAALCALLLHEAIIVAGSLKEAGGSPFYVHDERGMLILAVIPGTPAEAMGLKAGEVLHKVNGMRVSTKEELYEALRLNSAFCKLEVLNREGEMKFTQRARFAGEHHQLGVILAPDEQAGYYVAATSNSLLGILYQSRSAKRRDTTASSV